MKPHANNILTVVQTRVGSSRLPGKTLFPLAGKPLFVRQVERILAAPNAGKVVVATTNEPEDERIVKACKNHGIQCFRGSTHDLLDRHYKAALKYKADIVVKIPSDCPLIDPAIVQQVIEFYLRGNGQYDYVSNLHPATFPDGNDVEVMSFKTLQTAWQLARKPMEFEHTTPFIWEHPDYFKIGNVTMDHGADYSMSHRFTIDYPEDYDFVKMVFTRLYQVKPFFGVMDILALLNQFPEIYDINCHLAGVNWYRDHLHELKTISATQTNQLRISV